MTMGVHIDDNKLIIAAEPKTFHFDLRKDVGIYLKHDIHQKTKFRQFFQV